MTREEARALDAADPLAFARERFRLPENLVYLDGNSLGALPCATPDRLAEVVQQQWGGDLIASWNRHGWIDWPRTIAAKLAPILGARPSELLIADSTSICLFKALAAAMKARPERRVILTEQGNFPTDLYVGQSVAQLLGGELRAVPAGDLHGSLNETVAVLTLTHVDYRSSTRHDMPALNAAARASGALTVWDLSHSAGAVKLDLDGGGCDLAVGCGYKYLNGGPGAPAFLFVAERLQSELHSPIGGWMGHADPFAFESSHRPAGDIGRFLTGTPSILALAALDAGLQTFADVDLRQVEAKAAALSELFIAEVERRCPELRLASPRDAARRGSHVSFAHPAAYPIMQCLIEHGVVGDVRAPDLLRFGFAPLYNRHEDAWRAASLLGEIVGSREWDQPRFHARQRVT